MKNNHFEYRKIIDVSGIEIQKILDRDITELIIPKEIDGLPVISIDKFAFSRGNFLTSIAT